jgi:hypothetical protein
MEVEAAGFQRFEQQGIVVEVNGAVSINPTLALPHRSDSVRVESAGPLSQLGNSTIGLVLSRMLINDLPLISRNPFDLAFLAPGVSQAPGTAYGQGVTTPGFITNFISDGGRNAQADFLLDGVSLMNSDNNPGVQKALYVPPGGERGYTDYSTWHAGQAVVTQ